MDLYFDTRYLKLLEKIYKIIEYAIEINLSSFLLDYFYQVYIDKEFLENEKGQKLLLNLLKEIKDKVPIWQNLFELKKIPFDNKEFVLNNAYIVYPYISYEFKKNLDIIKKFIYDAKKNTPFREIRSKVIEKIPIEILKNEKMLKDIFLNEEQEDSTIQINKDLVKNTKLLKVLLKSKYNILIINQIKKE